MELILITVLVLVVIYALKSNKNSIRSGVPMESKPSVTYHYRRKDFVMTKAENELFNMLTEMLGDEYYVFPQMHLSAILDHRVKGQNWKAAFSHINQNRLITLFVTSSIADQFWGLS